MIKAEYTLQHAALSPSGKGIESFTIRPRYSKSVPKKGIWEIRFLLSPGYLGQAARVSVIADSVSMFNLGHAIIEAVEPHIREMEDKRS